ncbi:hypothetical protein [Phytoactinopolyspora endophytica]|uniref:hypothetical protein n=1 Tax=Phytoactinopolyspora endophytica TaxID=1642495 RepID=UPI00101DE653|nr:hypothetical protein [Phytoactinopolyspora endophytica]
MANHHFGKFADVWKHLCLTEVLARQRPARYGETHAGSAAYPMVDDPERRFGVLRFRETAEREPALAGSSYRALVGRFMDEQDAYPGSALLAMAELGNSAEYLYCDLDLLSTADLRSWPSKLGITGCTVAEEDGMTAVARWVHSSDEAAMPPASTVVHIDPFDPHAGIDGGPSALELAADLALQGVGLIYWYGYDRPDRAAWAYRHLSQATARPLWCGDAMIVNHDGMERAGDLGVATTPGTGCGIVLANVSDETTDACERLGDSLARAYSESTLPDGTLGRIRLTYYS